MRVPRSPLSIWSGFGPTPGRGGEHRQVYGFSVVRGDVALASGPFRLVWTIHAENVADVVELFGIVGSGSPAKRFFTRFPRISANGAIFSSTLAFSSAAI